MCPDRQTDFYDADPPQASRELAELRTSRDYAPPFEIVRRRVIDDFFEGKATIDATVVIRVGNLEETEAASGVGVVHALDVAPPKPPHPFGHLHVYLAPARHLHRRPALPRPGPAAGWGNTGPLGGFPVCQ